MILNINFQFGENTERNYIPMWRHLIPLSFNGIFRGVFFKVHHGYIDHGRIGDLFGGAYKPTIFSGGLACKEGVAYLNSCLVDHTI